MAKNANRQAKKAAKKTAKRTPRAVPAAVPAAIPTVVEAAVQLPLQPVPTTAAVSAAIDKTIRAQTILERCVCLTLERHYFGNDRKVSLEKVIEAAEGDATKLDGKQFHATKRLIPTDEILPLKRAFWVPEAKLRAKSIHGYKVFGDRTFLVPLEVVEEVDRDLTEGQAGIRKEAEALGERYAAAIERQKIALGSLFNEADYISKQAVIDSWSLDWSYVSFAAPEKLEMVSHALAMAAEKKHTDKLAQAFDEVLFGLRESACEVLGELEDRLTPKADGKTRVIRGTALRDLEEFVKYLPARNMTDDDKLPAIMARVAERAQGLSVETLRDDAAAREALRATVTEAKAAVAELVEVGRRGISFGTLSAA